MSHTRVKATRLKVALTPSITFKNILQTMNKKKYIKPEMQVEELNSEVLMFSGSLNDGEVDTEQDQLSTGRRGTWGDLWYKEED